MDIEIKDEQKTSKKQLEYVNNLLVGMATLRRRMGSTAPHSN
jgi:hypothetical protein